MGKYLTWDEVADFYKKKTGGRARIQAMNTIYEWAVAQPEIIEDKRGIRFRSEQCKCIEPSGESGYCNWCGELIKNK